MKRRKFIKHASCAGMGFTSILSSLLNMKAVGVAALANSTMTTANDYKALVCIFLSGGNDSFNMLLPRSGQAYSDYAAARSNNAINSNQIIALNPLNNLDFDLGLHPSLPNMANLFHNQRLAFVSNVGTLVNKLTVNEYFSPGAAVPLGLYSHSDQSKQWQTALPQDRSSIGWGGRMAELIMDMNANQSVSMNVSLSGTNFIQTGNLTVPYSLIPGQGAAGLQDYDNDWEFFQWRNKAFQGMFESAYEDVFEQTFVNTFKSSQEAFNLYQDAFEQTSGTLSHISFDMDDWNFGSSLNTVANTIAARNILNQKRQTFFVEFPNWDHHDELVMAHTTQLAVVDYALNKFQEAIDDMNLGNQVLTFVISEFGRPLISNGNGTDHAWGGNIFVMGDAVNGQNIFGRYPRLSLTNPDSYDIGGGIFLPEIACDEYFAELAMWFGVDNCDLPVILPNIRNFYGSSAQSAPIGFLSGSNYACT